jgi:hypothetical protein
MTKHVLLLLLFEWTFVWTWFVVVDKTSCCCCCCHDVFLLMTKHVFVGVV